MGGAARSGVCVYTGSLRRSAQQNVLTVVLVIFGCERRPLCNLFLKRLVPRELQAKNEKQLYRLLAFEMVWSLRKSITKEYERNLRGVQMFSAFKTCVLGRICVAWCFYF